MIIKYAVVDKYGNVAGHDLCYKSAEHLLNQLVEIDVDAEWEVIEM